MANYLRDFNNGRERAIQEALTRAYKRLRKEGYRCLTNTTKKNPVYGHDKYVFNYKRTYRWNHKEIWKSIIKFYFSGDIETVKGIIESEGLKIELHGINNLQFVKDAYFFIKME